MQIAVSELLVRYLERLGIQFVFGMPGAHVLPIYDALYRAQIRTVLAKHEQGAAFMAGGYSRISHRASACIATAGPGATNLVTGVANAYADKLPVLVITGETSTYIFGRGGLQESAGEGGAIDQVDLFRSITRYRRLIERTDYLLQVFDQATKALLGDPAGPVLLSIPYNVQKELVDASLLDGLRLPVARPVDVDAGIGRLAGWIDEARNPVIVAGYGCVRADARDQLAALSEDWQIPVTTSLKAKGVVAEDGPLALGCLGVTSNGVARRYIELHADLLIFLGAAFNERTSYLWDKSMLAGRRLAQVDKDAHQLDKVFAADLAVQGDVRAVLTKLLGVLRHNAVKAKSPVTPGADAVEVGAGGRGGGDTGPALRSPAQFRLIAAFYAELASRFPKGALVVDDNIVFAQSYLQVSAANHYLPNSGISSLGHAIPAAIGARLFATDAPTFAVLGDGGFQMCCMEIMTAVNYAVPLNVVVINNATMGLIRKNQFQLYDQRYIDCDFINPDFAALAKSFGIRHYRIDRLEQIAALFDEADLRSAINLIEIPLDKHAFPSYLSAR